MSKVFAGVDCLIDHALGVTGFGSSTPHYRSKKAALALRSHPSSLQTIELIERMRSQILANLGDPDARWRVRGGSWENWRWKKNLRFTPRSVVDEKTIEKLIATDCGDCWVNQIPTASGLLDKASETHCNIDLVKRTAKDTYEFIELKYDDATPLFAAFEILKYTLLLLISRERREDFKYSQERNPLLWARAVNLIVLAPANYYTAYSFRWLEAELNSALARLSTSELVIRFAFEQMPWPHDLDCQCALRFRERVYSNSAIIAASGANITGLRPVAGG
jgi:hypothetical protein